MIVVTLLELDHPDGVLRMSTLPWNWTDPEGRTWIAGQGVVSTSPREMADAESSGATTITWNGANAALIEKAFDAEMLRRELWMATVWLDDDGQTRLAGPMDSWAGLTEMPELSPDPDEPAITITAQSYLIDLGRPKRALLSAETQRRKDETDSGADFVATLADYTVNLGN